MRAQYWAYSFQICNEKTSTCTWKSLIYLERGANRIGIISNKLERDNWREIFSDNLGHDIRIGRAIASLLPPSSLFWKWDLHLYNWVRLNWKNLTEKFETEMVAGKIFFVMTSKVTLFNLQKFGGIRKYLLCGFEWYQFWIKFSANKNSRSCWNLGTSEYYVEFFIFRHFWRI